MAWPEMPGCLLRLRYAQVSAGDQRTHGGRVWTVKLAPAPAHHGWGPAFCRPYDRGKWLVIHAPDLPRARAIDADENPCACKSRTNPASVSSSACRNAAA